MPPVSRRIFCDASASTGKSAAALAAIDPQRVAPGGAMQRQGARLSGDERHSLVLFLAGRAPDSPTLDAAAGRCRNTEPFRLRELQPS
jgi:hypothetical protein